MSEVDAIVSVCGKPLQTCFVLSVLDILGKSLIIRDKFYCILNY